MAVDPRRGIVTPEAVLLEFELGGLGSRILAAIVDGLVQAALIVAVSLVFAGVLTAAVPGAVAVIFISLALFFVLFGYPIGFETLWNGRTPGKAALGLRVMTVEGAPIRFRHAAIRGALRIVDLWLPPGGLVAVLVSLFSARNQRLGDLAAGTIIVRERTATAAPAPIAFAPPPGWEPYTASLDVGALGPEHYGLIRRYLLRVHDLDAGARASLAASLAPAIADRLHHELPPTVAPEPFLVAVAAAYQRRHGGPAAVTSPNPAAPGLRPPPVPPPPSGGATSPRTSATDEPATPAPSMPPPPPPGFAPPE